MKRVLHPSGQQLLLVNLWASWCAPCVSEISDFVQHAAEFRPYGLNILALNVETEADPARAFKFLSKRKWPFAAGIAPPELLDKLDAFQRGLMNRHRPLPLPSSFLLNPRGDVLAIYKGPVEASVLLNDIRLWRSAPDQFSAKGAPFPGRRHAHVFTTPILMLAEGFLDSDDFDTAARYLSGLGFRQELRNRPGAESMVRRLARAQHRLANGLVEKERYPRALEAFRAAYDLTPADPRLLRDMAFALIASGDPAQAQAVVRELTQIDAELAEQVQQKIAGD